MLFCKHCSRECKNDNSLRNHERLCRENPNRQKSSFEEYNKPGNHKRTNQFIKAKELGLDVPIVSEETRRKISEKSKLQKCSDKTRKRLSEAAKNRGFGGVPQSRWIRYRGRILGSSYELNTVKILEDNNIEWDTCKRFNYVDNSGKIRTYTPDLYLPQYDVYLDPKNDFLINNINPSLGFSDSDKINWVMRDNGIKVIILSKNQINWEHISKVLLLLTPR